MASSFAALIKDLSTATPAELDPEDSYHSIDASSKPTQSASEEHIHHRPVSPSRLRHELAFDEEDPSSKYSGRKVSRREMMLEGKEDEDEGSDLDSDSMPSDEDPTLDDVEEGSNVSSSQSSAVKPNPDLLKFGPPSLHGLEDQSPSAPPVAGGSDLVPESTPLVQQLQASVKADIIKGKAIKSQLAVYDRLLGLRIGMQKVLTATNELSQKMTAEDPSSLRQTALTELLSLSCAVGTMRAEMMRTSDSLEVPLHLQRKRKADSDLQTCVADTKELDEILSAHLRTTVSKWSSKINAASSLSQQHKKFNAVNQNAMNQLDSLWAMSGEKERLIERTRIRRPTGADKKIALDPQQNQDIFDDRDFYHSLLKEVVNTNMRETDANMFPANRAQRTHRAGVDPKASKGRKIRYHVHEKLVSFMVPIPTDLWAEEQKDELFASLLGRGFDQPDTNAFQQEVQPQEASVGLGSLKLFG